MSKIKTKYSLKWRMNKMSPIEPFPLWPDRPVTKHAKECMCHKCLKMKPRTEHQKILDSLAGAYGQTKCLRTVKHARAVIIEEWAEKNNDGRWIIAETDMHRPASPAESRLLDRARTLIAITASETNST